MVDSIRDAAGDLLGRVPPFLHELREQGGRGARYRYFLSSPRPWCMYATVAGLDAEYHLRAALGPRGLPAELDRPADEQRLSDLLACQDAQSGLFTCPVCAVDDSDPRHRCLPGNWLGMTRRAVEVLGRWGRRPRHPLPRGAADLPGPANRWLGETFRTMNPASAAGHIGHRLELRVYAIGEAAAREDGPIREVVEWLCERQDAETGLFCAGEDLLNGMAGVCAMRRRVFELSGTPVPRPERIVRTVLSLQAEDGGFAPGVADACAASLLCELGGRTPEFRGPIRAALEGLLPRISRRQRPCGGFSWEDREADEADLSATSLYVQVLARICAGCGAVAE